tara:strand:- start:554 stop:1225 length:672 start_codon:yes stop_codon:yes gene_type:complete
MKLLEAINITKKYNENIILDSLSFSLNKNEIVSIFGPSGSGKTTLLNIFGLIDKDYNGQLIINNKDIKKNNTNFLLRRNYIGFIFQFHHLLPEFNIFDNLILPLQFSKLSKKEKNNKINFYLDRLGIYNLKYKFPYQVSGGERQRVSIIRSIINDPKIVIADEPTGNLDYKNSKDIFDLITYLKKESSISFIIATHDKNTINIADRNFNLINKKIKMIGKKDE